MTVDTNQKCQIVITCEDIQLNFMDHENLMDLLRQWDPSYYCYAYWMSETLDISLQVFLIFDSPWTEQQICNDFGYADSVEFPSGSPLDIRRSIITSCLYSGLDCNRRFLYHMAESGPCPNDIPSLEDYYADEEEMFSMIEQGFTDDEIIKALPSTADHIFEMEEYRQYYLSLPENL